jgi:hypothetical protein
MLSPWFPSPGLLKDLENIPNSIETATHSIPSVLKPAATSTSALLVPDHAFHLSSNNQPTYNHPMDYVKQRLQRFSSEFEPSPLKQNIQDRAQSAGTFTNIGTAGFFKFENLKLVDNRTGEEKEYWIRTRLTRHYAKLDFEDADPHELW